MITREIELIERLLKEYQGAFFSEIPRREDGRLWVTFISEDNIRRKNWEGMEDFCACPAPQAAVLVYTAMGVLPDLVTYAREHERMTEALQRIQNEGDAHSNAIATGVLSKPT